MRPLSESSVSDVACPDCQGRGEVAGYCCAYCDGRGRVPRAEVEHDPDDLPMRRDDLD